MRACDGISLYVREGETLGLVGESGSGKTTVGLAVLRLGPGEGRIDFAGQDLSTLDRRALRRLRARMQIVFQDPYGSLSPRFSVGDIVAEGLRVHEPGLSRTERARRVAAELEEVGLPAEAADRYPHEFSGGQRQRIAIARAMVLKPRFVVLDEPTSALDMSVQAQIVELLRKLQQRHGLAYLFISHDLKVVRALAHRVVVLRAGPRGGAGRRRDDLRQSARGIHPRPDDGGLRPGRNLSARFQTCVGVPRHPPPICVACQSAGGPPWSLFAIVLPHLLAGCIGGLVAAGGIVVAMLAACAT